MIKKLNYENYKKAKITKLTVDGEEKEHLTADDTKKNTIYIDIVIEE